MNYGYEGEVTLLVPVTPPPSLDPADPVQIQREADLPRLRDRVRPRFGRSRPDPAGRRGRAGSGQRRAVRPRPRSVARAGALAPAPVEPGRHPAPRFHRVTGLTPEAVRNAAYFPYAETAIDNAAAQVMTVDEIRPAPDARPEQPDRSGAHHPARAS
ncbi:hypothetical protein ACU4GR_11290 [Methylobacterium oryzae CBMB20]